MPHYFSLFQLTNWLQNYVITYLREQIDRAQYRANQFEQTDREQNNMKQTNWVQNYVNTYLGCSSRSRFKIILTGSICAGMQLCKAYEDFTEAYEAELQPV